MSIFFRDQSGDKPYRVMTRIFLKITVVCAACSMAAAAWAQSQSPGQPPGDSSATRSWSTKHLSATGRNDEHSVRASKLTGAPVSDPAGQRIGTVQDVIINPSSGRVDFAMLLLNPNSTSSGATYNSTSESMASDKLVPVPWTLLRTSASSSVYSSSSSGQLMFTLNADQNKLKGAPTVDMSDLNQSEWQQRIYSYYGVTPQAVGGAESPQGELKGEDAQHREQSTPPPQTPTP